jgi:hypothetical protein
MWRNVPYTRVFSVQNSTWSKETWAWLAGSGTFVLVAKTGSGNSLAVDYGASEKRLWNGMAWNRSCAAQVCKCAGSLAGRSSLRNANGKRA